MKSQRLFALATLTLSMALFATHTEAQIRRARYSTSQRPVYTYRPATTTQAAVRPAVATTQPAPVHTAQATATEKTAAMPASASTNATTGTTEQTRAATIPSAIWHMLARNNSARTSRGMRPMILSNRLTAAAQNHANYMARTGGFSHYSNGGPQGRAAMYGFRGGVRENIAMGQPTVESAFSTWTASGAHYANMMSHSDVAGFGYAVSANGQAYWVAVYGNNDGGN